MTTSRAIRVRLDGAAVRADPSGVCADVVARVDAARPDVVECDVAALLAADVATVDALARLGLAVRRAGADVVLSGADERLRALVRLIGLAEVLPDAEVRPDAEVAPVGGVARVAEVAPVADPDRVSAPDLRRGPAPDLGPDPAPELGPAR